MVFNPAHAFSVQIIAAVEEQTSLRPVEYVERHFTRGQLFYFVIEILIGEGERPLRLCYEQTAVTPLGPMLEAAWMALREHAHREVMTRGAVARAVERAALKRAVDSGVRPSALADRDNPALLALLEAWQGAGCS